MKTQFDIQRRLTQLERDRRTASEYRKVLATMHAETTTEEVNRRIGLAKAEVALDSLNECIALLEWVLN